MQQCWRKIHVFNPASWKINILFQPNKSSHLFPYHHFVPFFFHALFSFLLFFFFLLRPFLLSPIFLSLPLLFFFINLSCINVIISSIFLVISWEHLQGATLPAPTLYPCLISAVDGIFFTIMLITSSNTNFSITTPVAEDNSVCQVFPPKLEVYVMQKFHPSFVCLKQTEKVRVKQLYNQISYQSNLYWKVFIV